MKGIPKTPREPKRPRVLVVDHHATFAETIADGLTGLGFDAVPVTSSREAADRLEGEPLDALVTNLRMPELDGIDLLSISKLAAPLRPVLLMAEYGAVDLALAAMRQGAYHYLIKPFMLGELALFLERALEDVRRISGRSVPSRGAARAWEMLAGSSPAMRSLRDLVRRVAPSAAAVLISGETGTGKGAVARAIHADGPRSSAPFISLNCSAISEVHLDRELFARTDGSPGGPSARAGLLERARGGTLFLDEIGELSLPLQAKLLHVLESEATDLRIIAATRTNLLDSVKTGTFREDLVYRLDVISLRVPPLRSRREDVPELVAQFLAQARERHPGSKVKRFSQSALAQLGAYSWPGNVRELEQCVDQIVFTSSESEIDVEQLPPAIARSEAASAIFQGEILPLREIGRRYARWAYEQAGGKKTLAAERLQIDHKTLNKMLLAEDDEVVEGSRAAG